MSDPVAMDKARSLQRFCKCTGTPLHSLEVNITEAEGFELMDWFLVQADPRMVDPVALGEAIVVAKEHNDPWEVLEHFQLLGMPIARMPVLQ